MTAPSVNSSTRNSSVLYNCWWFQIHISQNDVFLIVVCGETIFPMYPKHFKIHISSCLVWKECNNLPLKFHDRQTIRQSALAQYLCMYELHPAMQSKERCRFFKNAISFKSLENNAVSSVGGRWENSANVRKLVTCAVVDSGMRNTMNSTRYS